MFGFCSSSENFTFQHNATKRTLSFKILSSLFSSETSLGDELLGEILPSSDIVVFPRISGRFIKL